MPAMSTPLQGSCMARPQSPGKSTLKSEHLGLEMVAQWLNPHTHRDPLWVLVFSPAAPLPIQLPSCGLGKQ